MRLFFHYCSAGFSNCYIVGTDAPPEDTPAEKAPPMEAIIIDPGNMDANLLGIIEDNNFILRGILITHDHPVHVRGINTIMRIYNTDIYAINPVIMGHRCRLVRDGDKINIGPFQTEVISIPGHSADSAVFKIERLLFTGDTLSAGLVGKTASPYAARTQISSLRSRLLSLPGGDYIILPGHGPPSSLEAERQFNLGLNSTEQRKKRRPTFWFEY